eukprot:1494413-Pyramimonas_sp.AAC.1
MAGVQPQPHTMAQCSLKFAMYFPISMSHKKDQQNTTTRQQRAQINAMVAKYNHRGSVQVLPDVDSGWGFDAPALVRFDEEPCRSCEPG